MASARSGVGVIQMYLSVYNAVLFMGWCAVFAAAVYALMMENLGAVYAATAPVLVYAQSAAVMECVHIAFGMVRSPLFSTLLQVFSRVTLLWIVTWPFEHVQKNSLTLVSVGGLDLGFSAGTMILAWSMSEMIRYSYYLLRELSGGSADSTPYLSTWLRYSGFIVLYPIGVASELSCCLLALPLVKATPLGTWPRVGMTMPNAFNIAIDLYAMYIPFLCLYAPGLPYLYMHMLRQRKKALAPKSKQA